jgi:hypothetical protein
MMTWMFRGGIHRSPGAVAIPFLARLQRAWRQSIQALRGSTIAILRGGARTIGGSGPGTVENKVVLYTDSGFTPPKQQNTVTTITPEEQVRWRTWPHNSWSSPDPCTYENPPVRRSAPSLTARDALTHITGKKAASGPTCGKHVDAGVIHSGRNGLVSSGRAYDEACVDGGS